MALFGQYPSRAAAPPPTRPIFMPEDPTQLWFTQPPQQQAPPRPMPQPTPAPAPAAAPVEAKAKMTGGMFGGGYKRKPDTWSLIGSTLQDVSAGLDRREGGNVSRLMDKTKAEEDDAAYREMIGGLEMDDPLEQMLAIRDPNSYLATKFGDKLKSSEYERKRKDELYDADSDAQRRQTELDIQHGYDLDKEAREAARKGRYGFSNTGQAIVRTDPVTGEAKPVYTDPDRAGAGRKQFRAATPEEMAARGYPKGTTGQFDSDGRLYPDKSAKPQSPFSQTEVRAFRGKADGLMTLGNAVDQYMKVLDEVSPKLIEDPWDKEGVQKLKAAHGLITSAIKDADSLGALDQGVQNLVNSIIADPVGLGTFGKDANAMKAGAKQVYDSIDYRLNRIPEEYRGGATGETTMSWRIPENVRAAQAALANWERLPANVRTPLMKKAAEKIVADFKAKGGATVRPNYENDPTDDDYDAAEAAHAGPEDIDLANPPEGVDPGDWDYLTDEQKRDFLSGGE